jgi:hypothetical protein
MDVIRHTVTIQIHSEMNDILFGQPNQRYEAKDRNA